MQLLLVGLAGAVAALVAAENILVGGAGSTHAAALAARPQVVVPFFFDQFQWAETVEYKEVGFRAEPEGVGAAIVKALGHPYPSSPCCSGCSSLEGSLAKRSAFRGAELLKASFAEGNVTDDSSDDTFS